MPDPFARKRVYSARIRRYRGQSIGIHPRLGVAEPGMEAKEAQYAQIILAHPVFGQADKADAAGAQIGDAADRVGDIARRIRVKRVHGEVAPGRVLLDPVGKGDDGAAAIGLHVAAKGRDLMRDAIGDQRDGAMVDPGRNGAQPLGPGQRHHPLGARIGRDVDIRHRPPQQPVAHAAADQPGLMPGAGQHRQHRLRAFGRDPVALYPHRSIRSANARSIRAVAPQM